MQPFRKRLLVRVAVTITLIIAALIAAIRVQQYVLRSRAERLQSELQKIECGKTSFEQARQLFERWGGVFDGACTKHKCSAETGVHDFVYAHLRFFFNHQRLLRIYGVLGGRPATVSARVVVQDDVVITKFYGVYVEVYPGEAGRGGSYGYTLIGRTAVGEGLPDTRPETHPSYLISWPSGCENCVEIHANFSSSASTADVQRVSTMDFSCVTRWVTPCKEKADIMPAAWLQVQKDQQSH